MKLFNFKPKLKLQSLYKKIDRLVADLSISGSVTNEPVPFEQRKNGEFRSYALGDMWGELFDCAWFNLQGKVPQKWMESDLYLKLDFNCELCLFNNKGVPIKGFTNKSSGFDYSLGKPTKRYFQVNDLISFDGTLSLWVDAGLNDLFGNLKKKGKIECAEVVTRNEKIRTLYYDLETLLQVHHQKAKEVLKMAFEENHIDHALKMTSKILNQNTTNEHIISSIGHAHIDLAWLWPIRETIRKGARTFANVLYLMDRYPNFTFGASQPQLYQWIKEKYPKLYENIREKIEEGRWEVQGGMWVESDTNVPCGESLARQMLYGIRYFQREFGIRVKSLWLPDVFGYNGNLPQIIKKSGLDYFMTIKLSWNRTNKFPHHTFNWKGIDGTSVFAHMPPEGTYNSPINAKFALKSQNNYQEKEVSNRTLNLFGIGDGGGGPGTEHLERLKRISDFEPLPKIRQEFSKDFFDEISRNKERFATYQGELYLEIHRGTYTSQARVKYFNRKLEQKLKTIETMLVHLNKHKEHKIELEDIWKEVLLYQFHDILPGSSIKRVYDECIAAYKEIDQKLDNMLEKALGTSLEKIPSGGETSVYNPLHRMVNVIRLVANKSIEFSASPLSDKTVKVKVYESKPESQRNALENNLIKVCFKSNGNIESVFDKELNKEILRSPGNRLKVYSDSGNAWNIRANYRYQIAGIPKLLNAKYFKCGSINYVEQKYQYRKSTITQRIFLHPDQKFLEFKTELNWQTPKKMLRTKFPLNLETKVATCDIQFGNITRSTQNKTKIERARWEVPAQKWVDMSNGRYGAAVITDSKYGYRIKKNTLDLNLLRATNHPGKEGDIGKHTFRYALYIHAGDHIQGEVDWYATVFNTWFPIYSGSKLPEPLLSISAQNIHYSTIKSAEDNDSLIIRLFESTGKQTTCNLNLMGLGECEIKETNLVEENEQFLNKGKEIELNFEPFEIKTLKIETKTKKI